MKRPAGGIRRAEDLPEPPRRVNTRFTLPDIDVFNFFRWGLSIVVSVYCIIVMTQQGYTWYVWLMTEDRYMSIVRQYVVLHGLRLRFRTFWGDVLVCILLCVVFVLLFHAHKVILSIDPVYR